MFIISFDLAFLSFTQFLLLTLLATPCFFLSCFFILFFTPILLYKRVWAFVGQIMLTKSKGSSAQFALICRSNSIEELYFVADLYFAADLYSVADLHFAADCFPLHFFLWTFLAFRSSWWVFGPCFSLGFPLHGLSVRDLLKLASTTLHLPILFCINLLSFSHSIHICPTQNCELSLTLSLSLSPFFGEFLFFLITLIKVDGFFFFNICFGFMFFFF